jgi:hypothetical protein
MTRSRCRSKSRSNRLKRNKTKRYRQTKNKRRRQHGGTVKKYFYTPGSQTIFKPGEVTDPVLIPGYSEIMDMMQEYEDLRDSNSRLIDQSKKLNDGINIKNVERLSDCSLPPTQILESKIIVVRKAEKSLLGIALGNNSIECNPEQYYALVSHNFRIFIRDILKWNPFLNLPEHKKKEEQQGWQSYQPRMYSGEFKPKSTDSNDYWNLWWNKQSWWTDCKDTIASAAQQSLSQPPSPAAAHPSSSSQPVDLSQQPPPQLRQQPNVELEQKRAQLHLLTNELKETLNVLQREGKITEEVKTTLTNKINQLLTTQQQSS